MFSDINVNARRKRGSEFIKTYDLCFRDFYARERMSEGQWTSSRKQKSAYIVSGKCQNTRCSVVSEVHKHVIVWAAAETKRAKVHHTSSSIQQGMIWWQHISCFNSAGSPLDHFSFGFSRVALQHCQEVFWGHLLQEAANQKSQMLLETCLNAYENYQNSRLQCSLWEHPCKRQSRSACLSVSLGWGFWKH